MAKKPVPRYVYDYEAEDLPSPIKAAVRKFLVWCAFIGLLVGYVADPVFREGCNHLFGVVFQLLFSRA